ncbi:uncharacterized protein LOC119681439 isoform X2 [Teleopsis dalmanni]|uniref:uncharacterized protein LOC119678132 isoform X2 n=1 Tax=Teleopsis dalmanni TaxID=139649 RepID=UPI0018CF9014|nr:uncharacterized protein LOC119678132 isoform X2 [Teleopsis dalmanni]XP_037950557.1 uncharacterized protein LOC119681439 isoform X2 [Teleopsis dalmanni]
MFRRYLLKMLPYATCGNFGTKTCLQPITVTWSAAVAPPKRRVTTTATLTAELQKLQLQRHKILAELTEHQLKPFSPMKSKMNYKASYSSQHCGGSCGGRGGKRCGYTISTWGAMKEFFAHPYTWEKNNGYINLILVLAIIGYLLCSNYSRDGTRKVSNENEEVPEE